MTAVSSRSTVIACPDAAVVIPVRPVNVNDCESKSTAPIQESAAKSKS